MEKTVKITGFEEKDGTKGLYWKVSTSPALIPKKALFIHNEEQIQLLEKDKHYHFVYETNDKGFIDVKSFEEVIDVNEDEPAPHTTKKTGDSREKSFALSYAKDAVSKYYHAIITATQEAPALDKMGKDIIAMADEFVAWLEK